MRDDAGVDALLAVVGHRQRLGVALGLVVDAARADRVDVAPVVLGLGMDLGVAVDLRGRGEQEPRPLELRQPEHVVGPVGADLERVERQPRVVDRARRRGEVVDEVDRLVDLDELGDVVVREDEVRRRGCARCSRASPVSRLSMQITRCPRPSRCSQRCEPRNPAPPVTTQVVIGRASIAADPRGRRQAGSHAQAGAGAGPACTDAGARPGAACRRCRCVHGTGWRRRVKCVKLHRAERA